MQGNATLDFFSYTTSSVISNVFESINQRPVGDVLQSMSIIGDYGYLVVNNSNKIEVVTMQDMKEARITSYNVCYTKLLRYLSVLDIYVSIRWMPFRMHLGHMRTRSWKIFLTSLTFNQKF